MTIETFGGRKAVGMGVILAIGVGISFVKGDVPPNLLFLLQVAFGAFVGGNAIEHLAKARAGVQVVASEPPVIDTAEIHAKIDQLSSSVSASNEALSFIAQFVAEVKASQNPPR